MSPTTPSSIDRSRDFVAPIEVFDEIITDRPDSAGLLPPRRAGGWRARHRRPVTKLRLVGLIRLSLPFHNDHGAPQPPPPFFFFFFFFSVNIMVDISHATDMKFAIGQPVSRKEDPKLLRGEGTIHR